MNSNPSRNIKDLEIEHIHSSIELTTHKDTKLDGKRVEKFQLELTEIKNK